MIIAEMKSVKLADLPELKPVRMLIMTNRKEN
jgi:hypothetical protein